ncbi:MAG: cation transporter [Cytophagales bacterium]|nr:cation transporter [Cytophaga sp.]
MYKRILSYCFAFVVMLYTGLVQGQTDTVRIGVNGLACSSCSKAVEEKIIKLKFVRFVKMDLNTNEATVIVDFTQKEDWNQLAKAVYDAGFSIGYFQVPSCTKRSPQYSDTSCAEDYQCIGPADKQSNPDYYILVGKYFMSGKAYTPWKKTLQGMTYIDPKKSIYYYY